MKKLTILMVILTTGLLLFECSSTQKVKRIEKSGFLQNYSQLTSGKSDEGQLIYVDNSVDFSKYKKIIIDPIQIWGAAGTKLNFKDRQMLMQHLDTALRDALDDDYQIVTVADATTIRLRVAITDAEGATALVDTGRRIMPDRMINAYTPSLAAGSHSFAVEAAIEGEILDSVTGKRLMAGVDRRAGAKSTHRGGKFSAIKDAYDHWAGRIKKRLSEYRTKKKFKMHRQL